MGVYIKGMETPNNCYECPLNTGAYSPAEYEKRYCHITGRSMHLSDYKRRPSDCPLVELPLHVRMIDADHLKDTIEYYIREAGWSDEINKALKWVKDELIDSEPTVIEAEGSE